LDYLCVFCWQQNAITSHAYDKISDAGKFADASLSHKFQILVPDINPGNVGNLKAFEY